MRHHYPVLFWSVAVLAVSSVACRPSVVPQQVLSKPAVPGVAATPGTVPGSWLYQPAAHEFFYIFKHRARLTVQSDTLSRFDSVSSRAEVAFTTSVSSNRVTGSVNAYQVQSSGHGAMPPLGLVVPFPFSAVFSQGGRQLVFIAPTAAPCVTSALPIMHSLRDLWFQAPDTLRLGTTWEDSATYASCRDGIPLKIFSRRRFRVTDANERAGHVVLTLSRISTTTIGGSGVQSGEPVVLAGSGLGQLTYTLDVNDGKIIAAHGTSSLELILRSKLRAQTLRQAGELQIESAP